MKYASFNAEGFVEGFFDDRINKIPEGAIQLTDEQYFDLFEFQGLRKLVNGEITKIEPPPPVETFPIISDRQFFQALAMAGEITHDEALAAVQTGAIPKIMQDYVDSIADPEHQFAVRMVLSGATQFERHNPLVDEFGHALSWSEEQINQLWHMAASL